MSKVLIVLHDRDEGGVEFWLVDAISIWKNHHTQLRDLTGDDVLVEDSETQWLFNRLIEHPIKTDSESWTGVKQVATDELHKERGIQGVYAVNFKQS